MPILTGILRRQMQLVLSTNKGLDGILLVGGACLPLNAKKPEKMMQSIVGKSCVPNYPNRLI